MKTLIKPVFLVLLILGFAGSSYGQGLKLPQASTAQTITQDFALGKITVVYSRPNVKGRKIFGDLEPFGKVWRTGANSATLVKFTEDITIEGKHLPAGEYGLFTIPDKNEWTVIFNKNAKQWGSYTYNESDDILRIKVKPVALKEKVETFTIQFNKVLPTSAQLQLTWENTAVVLHLTTNIDEKVMANIEAAMKTDRKPYFSASQYYFENGKDLNQALTWINEAEKADGKAPYIKLWKARIQSKMGDKVGAKATSTAGLALATEQKNEEYIRLHKQLLESLK